MNYFDKYEKYKNKNRLIGSGHVESLDDTVNLVWKNTEFLTFGNKEYARIKQIGRGSFGDVFLYVGEDGTRIAIKDFGGTQYSEENFNKEKIIYETIKQKQVHSLFPESKFIIIPDGPDEKYYLVMESLNEIDVKYIISDYHRFIDFFEQITNNIYTLSKNEMYYTDLKLNNIMEKDGKYYMIDYGGVCYPPEFDCQVTYFYIHESMKSTQDISNIDLDEIKNSYESILRESQVSPMTPVDHLTPKTPLGLNKLEYYLIFLIWNLMIQLFDLDCSNLFYHHSVYAITDFDQTKNRISSCKINILEQITILMQNAKLENTKQYEIHHFFKELAYGKIQDISQIIKFLDKAKL